MRLTPAQRAEVAEMIEAARITDRRLRQVPSAAQVVSYIDLKCERLSCLPPQQDNGRVV